MLYCNIIVPKIRDDAHLLFNDGKVQRYVTIIFQYNSRTLNDCAQTMFITFRVLYVVFVKVVLF